MSTDELRKLVGEPDKVTEKSDSTGVFEIWEYLHSTDLGTRLAQTGQASVPYVDPVTGQQRTMFDESLTRERTYAHETLEVLIKDARTVYWKLKVQTEHKLDD